jgi:hypothetical protein
VVNFRIPDRSTINSNGFVAILFASLLLWTLSEQTTTATLALLRHVKLYLLTHTVSLFSIPLFTIQSLNNSSKMISKTITKNVQTRTHYQQNRFLDNGSQGQNGQERQEGRSLCHEEKETVRRRD